MFSLFTDKKDKQVYQAEQKKQLKKLGSFKLHRGHKLFRWLDGELNELTDEDFNTATVDLMDNKKRTVIVDQDAQYISALNRKNAIRKLKKAGHIAS